MEDKKQLNENELNQVSGGAHGQEPGPRALADSLVAGSVEKAASSLTSGLNGGLGGGLGSSLENLAPAINGEIKDGLSGFGIEDIKLQ